MTDLGRTRHSVRAAGATRQVRWRVSGALIRMSRRCTLRAGTPPPEGRISPPGIIH